MTSKRAAFADGALDTEPAAVAQQHVFDYREAKAGAASFAWMAAIDAIETLGQARDMNRIDVVKRLWQPADRFLDSFQILN